MRALGHADPRAQPGRTPGRAVRGKGKADVLHHLDGDVWAIEWQGEAVRERMTARLDVLVWLDHPRALTMTRVVRRTLVRRSAEVRRSPGATSKGPLRTFFTDREHIVRVAWARFPPWTADVDTQTVI